MTNLAKYVDSTATKGRDLWLLPHDVQEHMVGVGYCHRGFTCKGGGPPLDGTSNGTSAGLITGPRDPGDHFLGTVYYSFPEGGKQIRVRVTYL